MGGMTLGHSRRVCFSAGRRVFTLWANKRSKEYEQSRLDRTPRSGRGRGGERFGGGPVEAGGGAAADAVGYADTAAKEFSALRGDLTNSEIYIASRSDRDARGARETTRLRRSGARITIFASTRRMQ